jgi:hypothetical protein
VVVVLDDADAVALLVQVADASVAAVVPLRVHPVQAVHPFGECVTGRLDDQVEVVVEDAVRVQPPAVARCGVEDAHDDRVAVVVVADDAPSIDPAHGDVEEAILREAKGAGAARHAPTVAPRGAH